MAPLLVLLLLILTRSIVFLSSTTTFRLLLLRFFKPLIINFLITLSTRPFFRVFVVVFHILSFMSKKVLVFCSVLCCIVLLHSCKSIGYRVTGISHIVRHDTITTKVVGSKPFVSDNIVDIK